MEQRTRNNILPVSAGSPPSLSFSRRKRSNAPGEPSLIPVCGIIIFQGIRVSRNFLKLPVITSVDSDIKSSETFLRFREELTSSKNAEFPRNVNYTLRWQEEGLFKFSDSREIARRSRETAAINRLINYTGKWWHYSPPVIYNKIFRDEWYHILPLLTK